MFTVFLAWFFESILGTMIPKNHMPYTVVSKPTWGANHPSQICLPSKLSQKGSAKPRIYLFVNYAFFFNRFPCFVVHNVPTPWSIDIWRDVYMASFCWFIPVIHVKIRSFQGSWWLISEWSFFPRKWVCSEPFMATLLFGSQQMGKFLSQRASPKSSI